jgi:START domain
MKAFIILFLFLQYVASLRGQGIWILTRQQDGIKIYSRHSEHSKFDDVKVEADLPGNVSQMLSILTDVARYPQWAYANKTCTLVKKVNIYDFIYYSEIEVPWPSSNRDLYAHCKITANHDARSFKLIAEALKDFAPQKKDIIRVLLSKAIWNVSTVSDKMIHIEYILELDPGGAVPAWLLNLFSTKGPIETFSNLNKKMSSMNK